MTALTSLLLATPIFGLSLTPPALGAGAAPASLPPPHLVALAADSSEEAEEGNEASAEPEDDAAEEGPDLGTQLQQRKKIGKVHRAFGIATWSAMTLTTILGYIQYHNLYGFFAGRDDNPCVQGEAIFGQGQCSGTPWPHLGAALATTALYTTTFTLSYFMPDPLDVAEQENEAGRKLRTHKLLRWVHFAGMVAQAALGVVVANGERFGLDRTNNYGALQGLATVHMLTGLVTYGALTWSGALMVF